MVNYLKNDSMASHVCMLAFQHQKQNSRHHVVQRLSVMTFVLSLLSCGHQSLSVMTLFLVFSDGTVAKNKKAEFHNYDYRMSFGLEDKVHWLVQFC